ncbi:hypothetical protein P7346_14965, partial [Staphylococcus aureus]|nr:hypothetical protein [Staphylococcus aureus]
NHTKPNIGGKSSIFHPKKTKIEDIFHGCLRFFGSKGTNGSAPSFYFSLYNTNKSGSPPNVVGI